MKKKLAKKKKVPILQLYTHPAAGPETAGLTKSRCPGVRSTLQTPLGSQKSLRKSREKIEKFSKIGTLFHRNISPMLLGFIL